MQTEIWVRCNAIEECYEFMLAYAAQGLSSDQGRQPGDEVRGYLHRALKAIAGLGESCATAVKEKGLQPEERYHAFFAVLDRDARDSLAAIELVLAQPAISSQLERIDPSPRAAHRPVSRERDTKAASGARQAGEYRLRLRN